MEKKTMKRVKLQWQTIENYQSFDTAEKNMAHDELLLRQLQPNQRIIRNYWWQTPGITFSYKQTCPQSILQFDHAKRLTGGGIVFHSPNDQVFSMAIWRNDPIYSGSLTNKLSILSNQIKQSLIKQGVRWDHSTQSKSINYDRCAQYPTPFEIIVNNKKICGLTIRRFKDRCFIQGIIHRAHSHESFKSYLNEQEIMHELPIATPDLLAWHTVT